MATLYIGNLPAAASKERLTGLVRRHTEVYDARLIIGNKGGRFRQYAFVEVADRHLSRTIRVLDGCLLDGSELRVALARPRSERTGEVSA